VHFEPFCTYIARVVLYVILFYVQTDKKKIRFEILFSMFIGNYCINYEMIKIIIIEYLRIL